MGARLGLLAAADLAIERCPALPRFLASLPAPQRRPAAHTARHTPPGSHRPAPVPPTPPSPRRRHAQRAGGAGGAVGPGRPRRAQAGAPRSCPRMSHILMPAGWGPPGAQPALPPLRLLRQCLCRPRAAWSCVPASPLAASPAADVRCSPAPVVPGCRSRRGRCSRSRRCRRSATWWRRSRSCRRAWLAGVKETGRDALLGGACARTCRLTCRRTSHLPTPATPASHRRPASRAWRTACCRRAPTSRPRPPRPRSARPPSPLSPRRAPACTAGSPGSSGRCGLVVRRRLQAGGSTGKQTRCAGRAASHLAPPHHQTPAGARGGGGSGAGARGGGDGRGAARGAPPQGAHRRHRRPPVCGLLQVRCASCSALLCRGAAAGLGWVIADRQLAAFSKCAALRWAAGWGWVGLRDPPAAPAAAGHAGGRLPTLNPRALLPPPSTKQEGGRQVDPRVRGDAPGGVAAPGARAQGPGHAGGRRRRLGWAADSVRRGIVVAGGRAVPGAAARRLHVCARACAAHRPPSRAVV